MFLCFSHGEKCVAKVELRERQGQYLEITSIDLTHIEHEVTDEDLVGQNREKLLTNYLAQMYDALTLLGPEEFDEQITCLGNWLLHLNEGHKIIIKAPAVENFYTKFKSIFPAG